MSSQAKNRSLLVPNDACHRTSSPQRRPPSVSNSSRISLQTLKENANLGNDLQRGRHKKRYQSGNIRRRKGTWKKLLWVKQSYPDNYTDQETFLEHLQRNPRLQPYDFWPLVADSTVIVQHVCSVIIFIVCFVGIYQEYISPISIVGWGSFATLMGWILWDCWMGAERLEREEERRRRRSEEEERHERDTSRMERRLQDNVTDVWRDGNAKVVNFARPSYFKSSSMSTTRSNSVPASSINLPNGLTRNSLHHVATSSSSPLTAGRGVSLKGHLPRSFSASTSAISTASMAPTNSSCTTFPVIADHDLKQFPHRTSLRLSTVKSALLIIFTLLGLSPILKSLTRSTSSDSIWTMSFLLFTINIFFFDYGHPSPPSSSSSSSSASSSSVLPSKGTTNNTVSGLVSNKIIFNRNNIPASLSTNAALMASTVLASRLPSTGQVFSLTLFSIEVFGLFPIFRHLLRQRSWRGHVCLTTLLVIAAGGGVGLILATPEDKTMARFIYTGASPYHEFSPLYHSYKNFCIGMLLGLLLTALAMGGCSWWLIGLQKYKNEIHGPWDPARPVLRRTWGDGY